MTDLAQLDHQKSEIIATVQSMPPDLKSFQPDPQQWSAVQILDHLARSEASILAIAESNLTKPHRIGIRDRIGVLFIERVFRSDRKVKVPASASRILPVPAPNLPEILAAWSETRLRLANFTAQVTPEQSRGGIFRHPVGGWMNLPQILSFFSIHIIHHEHQLARLRATSTTL